MVKRMEAKPGGGIKEMRFLKSAICKNSCDKRDVREQRGIFNGEDEFPPTHKDAFYARTKKLFSPVKQANKKDGKMLTKKHPQ